MGLLGERSADQPRAIVTCWCGGHWVQKPKNASIRPPPYQRAYVTSHKDSSRACLNRIRRAARTLASMANDLVRVNYFGSASRHSATTPEPRVEPPAATAKSMFSAKVDICTNAKRCRLSLATGINRINLTVPNWAHFALKIDSSSGSGSRISTFNKGTLRQKGVKVVEGIAGIRPTETPP